MQLSHALRLDSAPRLAFVGAGGKTTALFSLARELLGNSKNDSATVLITATTHLSRDQLGLADHHIVIKTTADISAMAEVLPAGVLLLTAGVSQAERVSGLDIQLLEEVLMLANVHHVPLLVEADGSRRRPMKAPADHEPAIPPWVEQVVVVAGLSALGRPLAPEWVHRLERFASLSGLSPEEAITGDSAVNVLTHPKGGLKNIPSGARKMVLLNQADTPERQAAAFRMADHLLGFYHAVLVTSFASRLTNETKHVTLPGTGSDPVMAVHESVAGIVLAGGESARFGRQKQVLDWHGEPIVRRVARTALEAGLSPVVVVTGAHFEIVDQKLDDLPVVNVHNPNWSEGQSTSVQAGISALDMKPGAVVFLLADQPLVTPPVVRSLVESHSRTMAPIVAPLVDEQRANPVLFDRVTFRDLKTLSGDTGGRAIFPLYPITWIPWHDRGLLLDVDTPEDYQRLKSEYG